MLPVQPLTKHSLELQPPPHFDTDELGVFTTLETDGNEWEEDQQVLLKPYLQDCLQQLRANTPESQSFLSLPEKDGQGLEWVQRRLEVGEYHCKLKFLQDVHASYKRVCGDTPDASTLASATSMLTMCTNHLKGTPSGIKLASDSYAGGETFPETAELSGGTNVRQWHQCSQHVRMEWMLYRQAQSALPFAQRDALIRTPYGSVAMTSDAIGATDHSDASIIDEFASSLANFVRVPSLKLEKVSMDFSGPSESAENTSMDISQSVPAVSYGRSAWIFVDDTQRTGAAVSAGVDGGSGGGDAPGSDAVDAPDTEWTEATRDTVEFSDSTKKVEDAAASAVTSTAPGDVASQETAEENDDPTPAGRGRGGMRGRGRGRSPRGGGRGSPERPKAKRRSGESSEDEEDHDDDTPTRRSKSARTTKSGRPVRSKR
jgi:hypothetical protein